MTTQAMIEPTKRTESPSMPAMNGPHRMRVVWDRLVQRGYAEDQIEKIMGRNLYRVYEDVIG